VTARVKDCMKAHGYEREPAKKTPQKKHRNGKDG
jgi:hypothetical protein